MRSNRRMSCIRKAAQRGFSLVSAIFLLIVLAGLAAAMVNVSVMQHTSAALDVQGTRAYQAARAGVEWGLYSTLIAGGGTCPAGPTSFSPAAPTLGGFSVTVTCINRGFDHDGDAATPPIPWRQLTATACNQPQAAEPRCPRANTSADYVQRVVQVTF